MRLGKVSGCAARLGLAVAIPGTRLRIRPSSRGLELYPTRGIGGIMASDFAVLPRGLSRFLWQDATKMGLSPLTPVQGLARRAVVLESDEHSVSRLPEDDKAKLESDLTPCMASGVSSVEPDSSLALFCDASHISQTT